MCLVSVTAGRKTAHARGVKGVYFTAHRHSPKLNFLICILGQSTSERGANFKMSVRDKLAVLKLLSVRDENVLYD